MKPNLETLKTFTEDSLPDLDTVVLGALEFLGGETLPQINVGGFKRLMVVGSGNALSAGRVIFSEGNVLFKNESTYLDAFATEKDIDAVCIISASGGKHAIEIVKESIQKDIPVFLLTNTEDSSAAKYLDPSLVTVFPKIREPYTYNTSTYLGMLLSHSGEDAVAIHEFIEREVAPIIPVTFASYDAFFLLVPSKYDVMREMFATKFDELFGTELMGRVFTREQAKHAKTVVASPTEYFISFDEVNTLFGTEQNRLTIPLPQSAGPAAMLAVGYYVIGHIQKQFPPFFKDNISRYVSETSEVFGQTISVIVE